MAMRIKLLSVAAREDSEKLVELVQLGNNGTEVDWEEVISGYSRKELDQLWEHLQKLGTTIILSLDKVDDSNQELSPTLEPARGYIFQSNSVIPQEIEGVFKTLQCLVVLATATVVSDTVQIPPSLLEISILFHDLLPSIPSGKEKLKDMFCSLFETFWAKEKPGREDLIDNTILHLFEMNMRPKATLKMLKRLWQLHEAFHLIKFDDPSTQNLRDQICQSIIYPNFLKRDDGVRILGSILPLNIEFMKTCHEIIKKNLMTVSRAVIPKYGQVYFRAWQISNEQVRPKLETDCIQDIMYHAIHASGIQLVKSLRKILSYIHRQKRQKGVDEMLNRLYAPILWRSLKAANSVVRLNSIFLIIDVFPLQNPFAGVEENNDLLQNQFNTFDNLLMDSCPSIRSRTILGVCQILSAYWQMIPKEVIKTYITTLIEDLAWDGASAEVRESVLKGIMLLFNCHYCHLILQPILPQLQNLFHDTSEKVRIAMVNLLIKVKGIRKIKYWSIVSVDHLLVRLAIDTQPVARRIMQIIFSSFLPLDKSAEVQVTRIICLIETNPKASRIFFQHAPKHMSLEQVVSFIVLLCGCILRCIRNEKVASDESFQERDSQKDETLYQEQEGENISMTLETNIIHGFLDAITILWTVIEPELAKPSSMIMKEKLEKIFSKAIPVIMRHFKDTKSNSALIIIASKIPPKMIPYLSHQCLTKLKKLDDKTCCKEDYSALIEMTCSWGKMQGLLSLILEWLTDGMKTKLDSSSFKQSKKQTLVRFSVEEVPKPILSVKFLIYIVEQPNCRALLLNKHKNDILDILEQLKNVLRLLEHHFDADNQQLESPDDQFLLDAYFLYIRLNLLIYTEAESQNANESADLRKVIYRFLSWAKKKVLPVLENKQDTSKSTRKRNSSHDKKKITDLACDLLQNLFISIHTYLLMYEIDEQFCVKLGTLFEFCIDSVKGVKLLPIIIKCLTQLISNQSSERKLVLHQVLNVFSNIIYSLARHSLSSSEIESSSQIMTSSRIHMSNFLAAVFDLRMFSIPILSEFYNKIVLAVLFELTEASKMGDLDGLPNSYQDLKPFTLWLLDIVFKKISSVSYFFKALEKYIQADRFTEEHQINGLLFMLNALLQKPKKPKSEIQECWNSLQNCTLFPKQTDLDDPSDNVGLKESLKEQIEHLQSVMAVKSN